MMERAIVIGAGLAGCEAAWQLAQRGVPVTLHEMKPHDLYACAPQRGLCRIGLLQFAQKRPADQRRRACSRRRCASSAALILKAADATRVPAGGALAVDREKFSDYVTQAAARAIR